MKFGKHTADYVAALTPEGSAPNKIAKLLSKIRQTKEIDAFRSATSHNGDVNDNG